MIVSQPLDQVVGLGASAQFAVSVQSSTPVTYRWYLNGNPILGETLATLNVANAHWGDHGRYVVAVQNAAGAVMSNPALLTVTNVPLRLLVAGISREGFNMKVSGPMSSRYMIEAGLDCSSWVPISTNTALGGSTDFTDRDAPLCPSRVYRGMVLESVLEQNSLGTAELTLKKGSRGAQSFSQGAVGGPDYWIRRIVIYVPAPTTNQGPSVTISIGTGLDSIPLEGSLVTVVPAAIANTNTATFASVIISFPTPIGPLASGTTYYVNMETNSANDGNPLALVGSVTNVYTKGTYYRDGNDMGGDLRFEIWGN